MRTKLPICGILALCAAQHCVAQALKIGDPAPPLKVMTWIKGAPVTEFKKGRVYVVDFWATWCGPCHMSMPHLSDIARKYAAEVTVIGVDARETEHATGQLNEVRDFVRTQGGIMAYNIAMDDPKDPKTFNAWMTAAGMHGIPTCFIIDKQGKIAWLGYPTESFSMFEQRVKQTVDGTIDLSASREHQQKLVAETLARQTGHRP